MSSLTPALPSLVETIPTATTMTQPLLHSIKSRALQRAIASSLTSHPPSPSLRPIRYDIFSQLSRFLASHTLSLLSLLSPSSSPSILALTTLTLLVLVAALTYTCVLQRWNWFDADAEHADDDEEWVEEWNERRGEDERESWREKAWLGVLGVLVWGARCEVWGMVALVGACMVLEMWGLDDRNERNGGLEVMEEEVGGDGWVDVGVVDELRVDERLDAKVMTESPEDEGAVDGLGDGGWGPLDETV